MTILILAKIFTFMLGLIFSGMTLDQLITNIITSSVNKESFYFPVSRFLFAVGAWLVFYGLNIINFQ